MKILIKYQILGKKVRAIYKIKNKKFEEINPIAPDTIHEQKRNNKLKSIEFAYTELERYINVNRLNNLESKMGPLTQENSK